MPLQRLESGDGRECVGGVVSRLRRVCIHRFGKSIRDRLALTVFMFPFPARLSSLGAQTGGQDASGVANPIGSQQR